MSAQSPKFLSFNWMRSVADASRISVVHRIVLMRLCLHRHNDGRCNPGYDRIADELGVDRATVFRAVDVGIRFGWLAGFPKRGGRAKRNFVFTFPAQQSHPCDGSTVAPVRRSHSATVAEKRPNSRTRATQQSQANLQDADLASEFAPNGSINGKKERGKKKESSRSRKRSRSVTDSPPADLFVGKKKEAAEEGKISAASTTSANSTLSARRQTKSKNQDEGAADVGEAFDRFWAVYPRRVAKEAARKAFAGAIKRGGALVEALIAGAQRYAAERTGQNPKYTKHPATWLNAGCWEDELPGGAVIDEEGNVVAVEQPPPKEGRRLTPLEMALAMDPGPGWDWYERRGQ
jgi:Helix-turn-helix domain